MGDANKKLKLYLRFPSTIEDKEIVRRLHPDILSVFFPRRKGNRWCIATFASVDTWKAAAKQLKNTKIGEKKLIVTPVLKSADRIAKKLNKRERAKAAKLQPKPKKSSTPAHITTDSLVDLLKKEEKP